MEKVQTEPDETFFDSRSANEWMRESGVRRSEMLFGELWMSGELCVMFGDAGVGKSLLAVQIADSITKRKPVGPFGLTAKAQNVLYVDLEKTAAQFKERYSGMTDEKKSRRRNYNFSKRFHRAAPKASGDVPVRHLVKMVEKTGAKIVIIDNLPHLVTGGQARNAGAVLRELRRLRSAYDLSILVIAQTSRSTSRRGIAAADVAWPQAVTSLADNMFAVGKCGSPCGRYIKHIKPRLAPLIYGTATVPRFEIESVSGVFPSFVHAGFGIEGELRSAVSDEKEWETMRKIKRLSDKHYLTVREIASEIKMSRSTVHRYLQMARATIGQEPLKFFGREACIMDGCEMCHICDGRPAARLPEYDEAFAHWGNCPDHCDICGPQVYSSLSKDVDPELRRKSAEFYERMRAWLRSGKRGLKPAYEGARRFGIEATSWLRGSEDWNARDVTKFNRILEETHNIEKARDEVEKWIKEGRPTKPKVKAKPVQKKQPTPSSSPSPSSRPMSEAVAPAKVVPKPAAVYEGPPFMYDHSAKARAWLEELITKSPDRPASEIRRDYEQAEEWCRPPGALPPYDPNNPFSKMERTINAARREIFVEHRAPDGQPSVWYQYAINGMLFKYTRDTLGIVCEKANANLFGKWMMRVG